MFSLTKAAHIAEVCCLSTQTSSKSAAFSQTEQIRSVNKAELESVTDSQMCITQCVIHDNPGAALSTSAQHQDSELIPQHS